MLNRSTQVYDLASHLVARINGEAERSTTVYDPVGRATAEINGIAVRVTTVYDAAGRSTGLIDGNAHRTTFAYDAAGRKIRELTPLLTRLTYGYDAVGRETLRIDPRGVRVSYAYNGIGKQVQIKYPDGSRVTTSYDSVGNRVLAQDSTGRYSRVYDPLNRVTASVQPSGKRLTFLWDAIDQRRAMVDLSGGRTTYQYNAGGELTTLVNPQRDRTTYTYDAAGQRLNTLLANGTWTTMVYDPSGRITKLAQLSGLDWFNMTPEQWSALSVESWSILEVDAAATIDMLWYQYEKANRRVRRLNAEGDRTTWTYDHSGQLTGEHQTGVTSYHTTYTYDPAGNRSSLWQEGETTTYAADANNRILYASDLSGRTTYSYDAAGNQTAIEAPSGDITTTTWDYESRQRSVETPDATLVTFTYNCDHWRVQRDDALSTVGYQWDKNNLLAELNDIGAVEVQYTNEPLEFGNLISQYRTDDAEASFYHYDVQGSTIALTDPVAAITDQYKYEAFGTVVSTTGTTPNNLQFLGQLGYYRDPDIERTHIRRREYDDLLARFVSPDPMRFDAGDENLFRYVSNNPVNAMDPSGLIPDAQIDAILQYIRERQKAGLETLLDIDGVSVRVGPNSILPSRTKLEDAIAVVVEGMPIPQIPKIFLPPTPAEAEAQLPRKPKPKNVTSLSDCTDADIAAMTFEQKLILALSVAQEKGLFEEELAEEIAELKKPENLIFMFAFAAALYGIGALATASGAFGAAFGGPPAWFAAAIACGLTGRIVIRLASLIDEFDSITTCWEIRNFGAKSAADALTSIGIDVIFLILTVVGWSAKRGKGGGKPNAEAKPNAKPPCPESCPASPTPIPNKPPAVPPKPTKKGKWVLVTSWADAGKTPDLKSGRWVMLGGPTWWNYIKTGLWGGKFNFKLKWSWSFPWFLEITWTKCNVPFGNCIPDWVKQTRLLFPNEFPGVIGMIANFIKWILQQREIK